MIEFIWVMRHGLAESHFESDFTRALSLIGKEQSLSVAEKILSIPNSLPQDMLVSPFTRTQETANIVHEKLGLSHPFETDDMLVHFADHKILGDYLLASNYKKLILISHMPIVANLCQYLVPHCDIYGFQTAQAVKLDFTGNKATVAEILFPS